MFQARNGSIGAKVFVFLQSSVPPLRWKIYRTGRYVRGKNNVRVGGMTIVAPGRVDLSRDKSSRPLPLYRCKRDSRKIIAGNIAARSRYGLVFFNVCEKTTKFEVMLTLPARRYICVVEQARRNFLKECNLECDSPARFFMDFYTPDETFDVLQFHTTRDCLSG